ncbi:MAG: hypothetical protein EYC68_00525 [Chloroflexota bacterium]|nr:MAG: hypothetical protein EYC68_00525 [Chloroflexota bacterium]
MFNSRYSEMEMKQWQDACANQTHADHDAPRHNGARAAMAKGQAEKKMSRTATAAMHAQSSKQDDWASECLFDCYNG